MTAPTDQFAEIATKAQESVTTAVRTWADALQSVADGFTGDRPALPDANVFVDRYFDFAQQVLDNQRSFTRNVLSASTQAAQAVSEQATRAAQTVTERTVNGVETATEKATAATRVVGEKTAANARAAKDAVKI
jgi:hypothetical protein